MFDIGRLHFHRFASTPIETSGAVATWSPRGEVEIVCNNGLPGVTVQMLAAFLIMSHRADPDEKRTLAETSAPRPSTIPISPSRPLPRAPLVGAR